MLGGVASLITVNKQLGDVKVHTDTVRALYYRPTSQSYLLAQ